MQHYPLLASAACQIAEAYTNSCDQLTFQDADTLTEHHTALLDHMIQREQLTLPPIALYIFRTTLYNALRMGVEARQGVPS